MMTVNADAPTPALSPIESLADQAFASAIVTPVVSARDVERVARTAAWFSERLHRAIEVVRVIDETHDRSEVMEEMAEATERLGRITSHPVRCRVVVDENPAAAMLEIAQDRLVCMPTSATPFKRRHFVESHAAALLDRTTQPVILIGPHLDADKEVDFEDIAVALAGDEDCLDVLPAARQLADDTGLGLRLIHVREHHDDHVMLDKAGQARLWFPGRLHSSLAVDLIDNVRTPDGLAAEAGPSLLMMATHARCGLERIAEGSVTFDTIAAAAGPIMVVGPRIGATPVSAVASSRRPLRLSGDTKKLSATITKETSTDAVTEMIFCPRQPAVRASGHIIAVVDGTDRAAEALDPAIALAVQQGRDLTVMGVIPLSRTAAAPGAAVKIHAQLKARGCDDVPLHLVHPSQAESELLCAARSGAVIVVSAFGTWKPASRLFDLLGRLAVADAPAIVGVGPEVAHQWSSSHRGPVVMCVDETETAEATRERLRHFLSAETTEIVLLHVVERPGESRPPVARALAADRWTETAAQIEERWGISTSAATITSANVTEAISAYAASIGASLLVMASHHRPEPGHPIVASTSMAVVAYAPCPVGILNAAPQQ